MVWGLAGRLQPKRQDVIVHSEDDTTSASADTTSPLSSESSMAKKNQCTMSQLGVSGTESSLTLNERHDSPDGITTSSTTTTTENPMATATINDGSEDTSGGNGDSSSHPLDSTGGGSKRKKLSEHDDNCNDSKDPSNAHGIQNHNNDNDDEDDDDYGQDHADDGSEEDPNAHIVWKPQDQQSTCEFTHTITNYSQKRESGCKMAEYSSTTIDNLGNRWRLIIYVNGNGRASNHHLSLFLQVADADDLPFGWKKAVSYVLTLEHPSGPNLGYAKRNPDKTFKLCPKAIDWGWSQFITSDRIQQDGYIHNDSLIVRASVTVKSSSVSIDPEDSELYLKYAVEEGNAEAVEICLSQGASVNCQFKDDLYTPLHTACSSSASDGSLEVLELLLEKGADGNACNKWRETPLLIAANNGHKAAVEALLQNGADPSMCSEAGWSALTFAAHKGYDDIVELLLSAGAPVNCKVIEDNSTPLHKACAGIKEGHLSAVHQLVSNGADVHALNKWRETPLLTAANHGQAAAVKALLEAGADPCLCTDTGWSPLSIAAYKGHDDVVELLLDQGAPTEEYDPTLSALLQAATKGLPKTVEILLRNGADHTVTTKKGDTALSILVEQNLIDAAVEMVTEYKASISRCSRDRKKVQRARLQINLRMKQQKEKGQWKGEGGEEEEDSDQEDSMEDVKSPINGETSTNYPTSNKKKKGKSSVSAEEKANAAAEELLLELEMEENKAMKEEAAANSKRNKKKKKKERERQQKLEQEKLEQEKLEKEAQERERQKRIREEKERKEREAKAKEEKDRELFEAKERKKKDALKKKEREAKEKLRLEQEKKEREKAQKEEEKKKQREKETADRKQQREVEKKASAAKKALNGISTKEAQNHSDSVNHSGNVSNYLLGSKNEHHSQQPADPSPSVYPSQAINESNAHHPFVIEPACVASFRLAKVKEMLQRICSHPLSAIDANKIRSIFYKWIARASDESLLRKDSIIPSWTEPNALSSFFQRQLIAEYRKESTMNNMHLMESGAFLAELCLSLATEVETFQKQVFASIKNDYSDVSMNINFREIIDPSDGRPLISIDWNGQSPLYVPLVTFNQLRNRFCGPRNLLYTAIYSTMMRYRALDTIVEGTDLNCQISQRTITALTSTLNMSIELWTSPMSVMGNNAFCGMFSDVDSLFGGFQTFTESNCQILSLLTSEGGSVAVLPSLESYTSSCYIKRILEILESTNGKGVPVSFTVFLPIQCFRDLQTPPCVEDLNLIDPKLLQSHRIFIRHIELLGAHQHTFGNSNILIEPKVRTSGSMILFLQNDSGRIRYPLTEQSLLQITSSLAPLFSEQTSASPTPFLLPENRILPSSPTLTQQPVALSSESHYTPGARASRNRRLFALVDDGEDDPSELVDDVLSNLDIGSLDIGIFQDNNNDVDIEAISLGMNFSNPSNGGSNRTHGRFG